MPWQVVLDPEFAVEAKAFPRLAQIEIAALAGLLPASSGRNFDDRIAIP
jgi:hypothetical protein